MTLYAPDSESKAFQATKAEYQKGTAVTYDLKPYTHLDIVRHEDAYYVPYTVFSDLFLL